MSVKLTFLRIDLSFVNQVEITDLISITSSPKTIYLRKSSFLLKKSRMRVSLIAIVQKCYASFMLNSGTIVSQIRSCASPTQPFTTFRADELGSRVPVSFKPSSITLRATFTLFPEVPTAPLTFLLIPIVKNIEVSVPAVDKRVEG